MSVSLNNKLFLEPYKGSTGLESQVRSGVAYVKQKSAVIGLKLVLDAELNDGTRLQKGSTVFFGEDRLHTAEWAKKLKKSPELYDGEFVVADLAEALAIVPTTDFKEEFPMNTPDPEPLKKVEE